jgi:hypothetical protein
MGVALAVAIVVGALAWSGLILAAPSWRAGGDAVRATASAAVYALADACHQRAERSFALGAPHAGLRALLGLYLSGAGGVSRSAGRCRRLAAGRTMPRVGGGCWSPAPCRRP